MTEIFKFNKPSHKKYWIACLKSNRFYYQLNRRWQEAKLQLYKLNRSNLIRKLNMSWEKVLVSAIPKLKTTF